MYDVFAVKPVTGNVFELFVPSVPPPLKEYVIVPEGVVDIVNVHVVVVISDVETVNESGYV